MLLLMNAALQHCTVAQLAEIFSASREEIIAEWRVRAGELLQELNLDKPTLTDHLPDLIDEITRDLARGRHGSIADEQTRGSPPVHGVQRFHDGLDVGEVVAEYNLLRVAFITIAERHGLYLVGEAARIINQRIDEGVRMAVTSFAAQQAIIRKEQENEHLAFIAHDLRTPLNAVSLLIDELKFEREAKGGSKEIFEILRRNLQRLEDLIKRVLDTKVQPSGVGTSFHPELRTFELWPLVQRLIIDFESGRCEVSGVSSVSLVRECDPEMYPSGSKFPLKELGDFHIPDPIEEGIPAHVWEMCLNAPPLDDDQPPGEVMVLVQQRAQARQDELPEGATHRAAASR